MYVFGSHVVAQSTGGGERPRRGANASRSQIKVRVGIVPGNYDDESNGVYISDITPNSSAEAGGLMSGDRIVKWNGEPVENIRGWMGFLSKHEPGDEVEVTVLRDDIEVVLKLKLQGREDANQPQEESGGEGG